MASGPPEHHVDREGRRLADRSWNFVVAAEKRVGLLARRNAERGGGTDQITELVIGNTIEAAVHLQL